MILLDTTVLVYAVGEDHRLREPCRRILDAHSLGFTDAAATIEVLQEFVHVRARRRSRNDVAAMTRLFAEALTIVDTTRADLEAGLELFSRHPALGCFDALLAATALRHGAEALVSADPGFRDIRGLNHLDPTDPALLPLLHPH